MSEVLKLRVIDLGEKQVVQRLSGERKPFFFPYLAGKDVQLDDYTIDEMKDVFAKHIDTLNAELSAGLMPRIEPLKDGSGYYLSTLNTGVRLPTESFKALEQIIGHEIPIYEPKPKYTGEWRDVLEEPAECPPKSAGAMAWWWLTTSLGGIEIWEYTVNRYTALIEVKSSNGPVQLSQLEFVISYPGVAGFVTTPHEAINLATNAAPLTGQQRFNLQKLVDEMKEKGQDKVSVNIVKKRMGAK